MVALLIAPVCAGIAAWEIVAHEQAARTANRFEAAASFIGSGAAVAGQPSWQRRLAVRLDRLHIAALINERTPSGKRQLYPPPHPAGNTRVVTGVLPSGGPVKNYRFSVGSRTLLATLIAGAASRTSRLLWTLVAVLITVAAGLAAGFWLLGRWLSVPMLSLSDDVDRIASGEPLAERPRRARLREIENISEALAGMSSALRDARRREADVERERSFLISAIAHDLRTPLFALRGYLEAQRRGVTRPGEDYVELAEQKAAQIDHLVGDLFTYSRSEFLDEPPLLTRLDLGGLLADSAAAFRSVATAHGVALTIRSEREVTVNGDPDMLQRVVANLLDNALQHGDRGGVVTVSYGSTNENAWFAVADDGPGVAAEDLLHVFEPLYRADASRQSGNGGAGLGLAIAKRLVEAHGGELTVHNENGAVFTVVLPSANPLTR
jgi:signal transduction histidine kinase